MCFPPNNSAGNSKGDNKNGYATLDPRKMRGGAAEGGPQYDEIPYEGAAALAGAAGVAGAAGGHSGKGQLPEVPADYAQVPELPQRQGENNKLRLLKIFKHDWPTEFCKRKHGNKRKTDCEELLLLTLFTLNSDRFLNWT